MLTARLRRERDEDGAFGLLFGVLLGSGALFALVALVFDFGLVNVDHSQLQSSADAAARQAGIICATTGTCPDAGDPRLTAIARANDNPSTQGVNHPSTIIGPLCGVGGGLASSCSDANNDRIAACPSTSGWSGDYVEVRAQKPTDETFGRVPGGRSSVPGQGCARVAWGKATSFSAVLPVTFSVCEWSEATQGDPLQGTGHYASDPPTAADSGLERTIVLAKQRGICPSFNGHDAPGGFGWLASNGCRTSAAVSAWVKADTGNDMECSLSSLLGSVAAIPAFDCEYTSDLGSGTLPVNPATQCATGNGQSNWYHVAGFAGFYLTGWYFGSGHSQASIITGRQLCSGAQRCLYGFFVRYVAPGHDISDDPDLPDFGVKALKTIG
ncbi:MAG: TadE/TadG family type IV pilus assembly protein [Marmoricola sp.]